MRAAIKASLFVLLTAGAIASAQTDARAQEKSLPGDPDTVVARIDGDEVLMRRMQRALQSYGRDLGQLAPEVYYRTVMDRMIDQELAARAGAAIGLAEDPDVMAGLAEARANVLAAAYLRKVAADATTQPEMRRRYEVIAKEGVKTVSARHILVKTEDEAKDAIQALKDGADFAELAEVRSIGPSAKDGGNLGFFGRQQMVKPFADAAFRLDKGDYTKTPVETQFGWHVILVEDIKSEPPPPFHEMFDQLRQEMATKAMIGALEKLRVGSVIERYGPDGALLD